MGMIDADLHGGPSEAYTEEKVGADKFVSIVLGNLVGRYQGIDG